MFFWLLVSLLTLSASLAVMQPFLSLNDAQAEGSSSEVCVYPDQIFECEKHVRQSAMLQQDANRDLDEIPPSIPHLKQPLTSEKGTGEKKTQKARTLATVAVLAVAPASWGLYALLGSPDMISVPLRTRLQEKLIHGAVGESTSDAKAYIHRW